MTDTIASSAAQRAETILAPVDSGDLERFLDSFSAEARFKFGNNDAVYGRDAIRAVAGQVMEMFTSITHEVVRAGCDGTVDYWDMLVTYCLKDGKDVTLPAMSLAEYVHDPDADAWRISDYQVYIDMAPALS